MKKIRSLGMTFVAIVAFSAIAATAARATAEGPIWQGACHEVEVPHTGAFEDAACTIAGGKKNFATRLLSGETAEIEGTAATVFRFGGEGLKLECKQLKLEKGSVETGSTGANSSGSNQTIKFEECIQKGNNEESECKVANKKTITTKALTSTLAYEKERAGKLLVVLRPVAGAFMEIAFEGKCKITPLVFEGNVGAEVWSGGKVVEVGKEVKAVVNEVNFPATAIKTAFEEKEGKLEKDAISLKATGLGAGLEGRASVKATTKAEFGVFTK